MQKVFLSKSFLALWLFHFFCLFSGEVLRFALPLWFYVKEGDLTLFSIFISIGLFPRILSPFLGGLVDYYKPKKILVVACFGLILISCVFALATSELISLSMVGICLLIFLMGMFSNSIHLATLSSISKIVKKENLLKGNSLMISAESSSVLIAPLLGGYLIYEFGITAVVLIGISLFLCSSIFLTFLKVENMEDDKHVKMSFMGDLKRNLKEGCRFIRSNQDLKLLLCIVPFINLIFTLNFTFFMPMVLQYSNNNSELMGLINFVGGCGQIMGALLIGWLLNPSDRISAIYKALVVLGITGPFLIGINNSPIFWGLGYAFTLGLISIINTMNNSYWQALTPTSLQGTVFGIRRMITSFTGPLGALMAVPALQLLSSNKVISHIGSEYQIIFISSGVLISAIGICCSVLRPILIQDVKV